MRFIGAGDIGRGDCPNCGVPGGKTGVVGCAGISILLGWIGAFACPACDMSPGVVFEKRCDGKEMLDSLESGVSGDNIPVRPFLGLCDQHSELTCRA